MAEFDEESIEFLDEDADIVQQCVQVVKQERLEQSPLFAAISPSTSHPLLVERRAARSKRKRKIHGEDSDYDPKEDAAPPSPPPSPKNKKKKPINGKKVFKPNLKDVTITRIPNSNPKAGKKPNAKVPAKEFVVDRKKIIVRIPDYDDPLCLPVKAIQQEPSDTKRLNNWNNVCLEHFKHCDNLLKPERGETHSSTRTVVFRNVFNKQSSKKETTIWSKTCVQNVDGDKKSEIFQCVLPRYREKSILTNYGLITRKPKPFRSVDEAILTKEDHKESEVLVVYKPRDALSAVYKLVKNDENEAKDEWEDKEEDDMKMYMKEQLCCRMCVPCFQTSWRGVKRSDKKPIACPICRRSSFVTAYNLLAHFKTHPTEEIRKYKSVISKILSEIVDYHYKCRVCREHLKSIKKLRQHIVTHQGNQIFTCEVCHRKTR